MRSVAEFGVDVSHIRILADVGTSFCFVSLDHTGEKALTIVRTPTFFPSREHVDLDALLADVPDGVHSLQVRADGDGTAAGAAEGSLPATPEQLDRMVAMAERSHNEGALGVGFGIEYIPGTSGDEVVRLAEVAARYDGSLHAHIRLPHLLDPFQGINELIAASAVTGARTQLNSSQRP